jgi:hypothetical protein
MKPASSVFDMARAVKRAPFNFANVKIRPPSEVPPLITGGLALLLRMKQGESVVVPHAQAKTLLDAARRAKIRVAARRLDEGSTGVWRL